MMLTAFDIRYREQRKAIRMVRFSRLLILLALPAVILSGSASAQKKQMAEQRVRQLMQEFESAWEAEQFERILACYSPDYRYSDGSGIDQIRRQTEIVCENPNIKVDLVLDDMKIEVKDDLATVEHARSEVTTQNGKSLFGLTFRLHKQDARWLIVWSDAWGIEGTGN